MMQLYSIYDSVARYYSPPFMSRNNEAASRECSLAASTPGRLKEHLPDFKLYHIGSFDEQTGTVSPSPLAAIPFAPIQLPGAPE